MNLITCKKFKGGGGNSLKFRVESCEFLSGGRVSSRAVGGSSSSWRFGKGELGRGKRNFSFFNLHFSLSFILSVSLLFGVNSAWAKTTNYYQVKNWEMSGLPSGDAGVEITTEPLLVFSGVSLDDIFQCTLKTQIYGDWVSSDYADAWGVNPQRYYNGENLEKLVYQFCVLEGTGMKGVIIVLTNGEGGVYAQRYGRCAKSGVRANYFSQIKWFTMNSSGDIAANEDATLTVGDDTFYRASGLQIHGMRPQNNEAYLAFPDTTLAQLKGSKFIAGYRWGDWLGAVCQNNEATFVTNWPSDDNIQKTVMQFTHSSDGNKTAVIELTESAGGVYAKQVLGGGLTDATKQGYFIDEYGNVTANNGTTAAYADKYCVHEFYALPPCVKMTPSKVWSSGDSENPLTLDDIVDGTFASRFFGAWVTDKETYRMPNAAKGTIESKTEDDFGSITNMVVWFEIAEDRKRVKVILENGEDGIYATAIEAKFYDNDGGRLVETYEGAGYALCDLRVTVPTVHKWTLNADKTWSELRGSETVAADEVVKITVEDPAAVLTVDEDVTAARIEFVGGNCAQLIVNSGKTLTAENISGATKITNNGTLVKTGDGTLSLPFDNASTGTTTVSNGTLKVASQTGSGKEHTVRVKDGATFDLNGYGDNFVRVILEDGAHFVNTRADIGYNTAQTVSLTLEGDATATATCKFGLVAPSWGDTTLNLGSHTLEVNTPGDKEFILTKTTISGDGTIYIVDGRLSTRNENSTGANCTITIGANGLLENNMHLTVKNFVNNNRLSYSTKWGRGELEVTGRFESKTESSFPKLTLTGATVKATGAVATVLDEFKAFGTITIDASEITKDQLKVAGEAGIAVLTVPALLPQPTASVLIGTFRMNPFQELVPSGEWTRGVRPRRSISPDLRG